MWGCGDWVRERRCPTRPEESGTFERYVDTGAAGEGWRAFRVLVVGGTAAAAVGADHAGVDLIRDRSGGLQVLEVNGIPAWRGLQGTWCFTGGGGGDELLSRIAS